MSTQTATMSTSSSSSPQRIVFVRKLMGSVLFIVGIAGCIAALNRFQENLSLLEMTVFAVLAVGVAAGAISRASFFIWHGIVRFLMMLVTLLVGMFALGFFSVWQLGIGPLEPWLQGKVANDQLFQLGGAFLVALLTLTAWRKPTPKKSQAEPIAQIPVQGRPRETASSSLTRHIRFASARASEYIPPVSKFNPFPRIKSFPKLRWRTPEEKVRPHPAGQAKPGFRQLFKKRKPNVQVSLYEIHRCPYCLEEVRPNDPRGVKKCDVCNTLHHADCWDVTGFCQVPHLNT